MKISDEVYPQLLTLRDWVRWGASLFNSNQLHFGHGTDNAWDEAIGLVLHALHLPPDSHPQIFDAHLTLEEKKIILDLFQMRVQQRMPAPYITHTAWFSGMKFYVDQQVLIPRSSIGELIEKQFTPWVIPEQIHHVLDLCTGSGCIAVAATLAFPEAMIDAVDICEKALAVAQKNISTYGLEHQIQTVHSDLFHNLQNKRYDLIISNPPYVSKEEMTVLPEEYRHEPTLGLLAENDGLEIVTRILQEAEKFLTDEGVLIVEVGNSEQALAAKFPQIPFTWLEFERGEGGVFLLTCEQLRNIGEVA